jgi:hypothetical protein
MGVRFGGDAHFTESVLFANKTAKASFRLKTKVWNQKRDNQCTVAELELRNNVGASMGDQGGTTTA